MAVEKFKIDYDYISKVIKAKGYNFTSFSEEVGYTGNWYNENSRLDRPLTKAHVNIICNILGIEFEDAIITEPPISITPDNEFIVAEINRLSKAVADLTATLGNVHKHIADVKVQTSLIPDIVSTLDNLELGMSELADNLSKVKSDDFSKAKAQIVSLFKDTKEITEDYALNRCKEFGIDKEMQKLAFDDLGIRLITRHTGKKIMRFWALPM